MKKIRQEAFSDGVIAVALTIIVLEVTPPHGTMAGVPWIRDEILDKNCPAPRSP